ncbi:MAG: amidoligase family protein [Pseudomonadota bacterium]
MTYELRPLPTRTTDTGEPRRVGIELEFAGLSEERAAQLLAERCGARVARTGTGHRTVQTARFGSCELYLDTRLSDELSELGGDRARRMARAVVPVELVTEPFEPKDLSVLEAVVDAFRQAGAQGSGHSLAYGFGLHLNVEVASLTGSHMARVVTAYALLEDYLRHAAPLDWSRRVLPFTGTYPDALVDALAAARPRTTGALLDLYTAFTVSRNHGLDMLPAFAAIKPDVVWSRLPGDTPVKARPAYHFRLPDSRIDEPDWSVTAEWNRWVWVEEVASQDALMETLCDARMAWTNTAHLSRGRWAEVVGQHLPRNTRSAA